MKTFTLASELPAPRRQDLAFDALCEACAILPAELTRSARGAINRAMAEIRAVNSQLTGEEIKKRARRYREIFPNATLTPSALARHWAECWALPPKPAIPPTAPALPEPPCDWGALIASDETLAPLAGREWELISRGYQEMIYRALKRR